MGRMVRCDVRSIVILAGPSDQPISVDQKRINRKTWEQKITTVEPPLCRHQSFIEI